MPEYAAFTFDETRQLLSTCRQLNSMGILRYGTPESVLKKYPRITGDNPGEIAFFVTVADWVTSAGVLARRADSTGTAIDPTSPAIQVYRENGRPAGAVAGYYGLFYRTSGTWRFLQGPCVDIYCDPVDAEIVPGAVPDGTINESYSHTITWTDLDGNPTASGLPPGLFFNQTTGVIAGTPTQVGEFTVVVSGISDPNGCVLTVAFNITINPCDSGTSLIDPDSPPDGVVSVAYSHTVILTDLDGNASATNLPPGLSFNGSTGAITGTPTTEGSWVVIITGTSDTNNCPIYAEFVLTIGTCNVGDSALFNLYGAFSNRPADELPPGFVNEYYQAQIGFIAMDLPLVLANDPNTEPLPDGITFDGDTGILSGTPTECGDYIVRIEGTTDANECTLTLELKLKIFCDCPASDDYLDLDAWVFAAGTEASSEAVDLNIPFNEIIAISNATFRTVEPIISNLPPGLFWDAATGEVDGIPDTPGTYVTVFYGTVTSGDHEGCQIIHTRTYTVS
jgi:hypothetical protein